MSLRISSLSRRPTLLLLVVEALVTGALQHQGIATEGVSSLSQKGDESSVQLPTSEDAAPPAFSFTDMFIFGGQSNCVGMGQSKDLTGAFAHYLTAPSNMLGMPIPVQGGISDSWAGFHIRADQKDTNFGNPFGEFGPDLSFGHKLAGIYDNDVKFGIIKSAVSGSGLEDKWLNSTATPNLLSVLINRAKSAQAAAECKDRKCHVKALVWVQGEEDAHFPEPAAKYKENLRMLVMRIREELHEPELFVIIVALPTTGHVSRLHMADTVRQAQNDFVKEQGPKLATIVSADNIETYPKHSEIGDMHYTSQGLILLGERIANAYIEKLYPGRTYPTWKKSF